MRGRALIWGMTFVLAAGCGGQGDTDEDFTDRMATEHEGDAPVASPAAKAGPARPVTAERVVYATIDGQEVTGYLARPESAEDTAGAAADDPAKGPPAIILIHEWWGLNENIESMARQLAGEGYAALAVDLYGGEVAGDRDAARALMQAVNKNKATAKRNLRQARAYLKKQLRARKAGVIGWSFGGGWALQAALLQPDRINATVIYYGRLVVDSERLAALESPVLGIFGSEDQGVPIDSVRKFESALQELGKDAAIHVYEGANHAFANPSGTRYNAEAATDAWEKTLAFLRQHLTAGKG